jgi:hypothetical protein
MPRTRRSDVSTRSQLPDSTGVNEKRDGRRKKGAGGVIPPHKGAGSGKHRRSRRVE